MSRARAILVGRDEGLADGRLYFSAGVELRPHLVLDDVADLASALRKGTVIHVIVTDARDRDYEWRSTSSGRATPSTRDRQRAEDQAERAELR